MKYLTIILFIAIATPAFAQLSVDSGIRTPKSVKVSVVDGKDGKKTDDEDDDTLDDLDITIPDDMSEEDREKLKEGLEDTKVPAPITPESPSAPKEPKKATKQVIKPVQKMKIRRSIADDRIDDGYVQEMIKKNNLFTNDYKTKDPNKQ